MCTLLDYAEILKEKVIVLLLILIPQANVVRGWTLIPKKSTSPWGKSPNTTLGNSSTSGWGRSSKSSSGKISSSTWGKIFTSASAWGGTNVAEKTVVIELSDSEPASTSLSSKKNEIVQEDSNDTQSFTKIAKKIKKQ